MKIASAALQMESSHTKVQQHETRESLRMWRANQRPDFEGEQVARLPTPDLVQISQAGKLAQSTEASAIESSMDAAENDPMLSLIKAVVTMLTGKDFKVFDAAELNTGTPAAAMQSPSQAASASAPEQHVGYGIEYDRHESYTETENTRFDASGVIRTTDGKEISFSVSLSMTRSYHEESDVSIREGDARRKKDPLLINFGGSAAQLSSQRFKFDLDADGQAESINFVTGGGFLALDRNGDGKINNGAELFGAHSGDGFAELSQLDDDRNGWIDENDTAYDNLRVWSKDEAGKDHLATLRQANVGALGLARIATPFDLKDGSNALQGQIRSSGVFLREDGGSGTVQQVDLTV